MMTNWHTLLLALLLPSVASAQVPASVFGSADKVSLLPDGSYFFNHTDSELVFEAQVAPDVRIKDNFGRQLARVLDPDRPRVVAYSLYATPMFRLRMFNEESNPVRTPSYMPKVSLQVAWLKNLTPGGADEPQDGPIEMWVLHSVPFGHLLESLS